MRIILFLLSSALLSTAIAEVITGDDDILSLAQHRLDKMTRVTAKPQFMSSIVITACGPGMSLSQFQTTSAPTPPPAMKSKPSDINPHVDKFFHVYVTNTGAEILKSGKGVYPEGTVILKEKFSDADGKTTELFTGMLKRGKGYNPDAGDWEFFVLSGDAKKITQRGKIESCMNCHDSYQSTDYVTRNYPMDDHP